MTNYELFWLMELPGGALGGSYGNNRIELSELPINETLAGRINAHSIPGTDVRLHLPILTTRRRKEWPTDQLELPVVSDQSGRIVAGDESEHQYAALLAAPRLPGSAPAPIFFRDRRDWLPQDWELWVRPMLAAHKIQLRDPGWKPAGPFRLSWDISLPAAFASAWADIPHRRDARFLDQFRGVSTSVQKALRAWLPFQYFANPQRYAKTQFAHPYLAYGLLPPHPSRRKTQLTFHVLEPQRVERSMNRLGKPMAAQIRRAIARMEAHGVAGTGEYEAVEAAELVRSMRILPRTFASLLSLEAFVVEELVRFASVAYDAQTAPLTTRALVEPSLELHHNFRCRLGRSYGGETYTNLINLILVAAMAGLVWRQELEQALTARVCITELESGHKFVGESRFSYASF